ncbi:Holliday junction resolvase RuvX [Carboxydochorda subterranea]|uniref:Putative pre-16S rRNA nuclease n=1 Tax=Carboxydichorda subterranea TaxID=3109565 RepID=A0ABZ1BZP6_9FIRM|nr:Holliday junction resolvase RuvX [Limnochorda sp. L945t]WRP18310.1 Holliday junction resolvase RuvX [Limnochorda sp. L945t]
MRPVQGRIMALDVGEKSLGVAISDSLGATAQPLVTLWRKGLAADLEAVSQLVRSMGVEEVVVGLPTRTDGREGPEAERVRAFAGKLRSVVDVRVRLFDERFSTRQAERILLEADLPRRRRRRAVNHVAAAIILDAYLTWRQVRRAQAEGTLHEAGDADGQG